MAAEFYEHAATIGAEGLHRASELDRPHEGCGTQSPHRARIRRDALLSPTNRRIVLALGRSSASASRNASRIPSMCALWAAKPMSTRRHHAVAPSARPIRQRVEIAGHDGRIRRIEDADGQPVSDGTSRGRTSASTAQSRACRHAAQSLQSACRAALTRRAPSSRSAPAPTAAAISPAAAPDHVHRRTRDCATPPPADRHRNSTGCTTSTRSSG